MSELTGEQFKELENALLSAFRSENDLAEMLRIQLDISLAEIVDTKNNLKHQVHEAIDYFESLSQIDKLIEGARIANPHNNKLKELAKNWSNVPAPSIDNPTHAGLSLEDGNQVNNSKDVKEAREDDDQTNAATWSRKLTQWIIDHLVPSLVMAGLVLVGIVLLSSRNGNQTVSTIPSEEPTEVSLAPTETATPTPTLTPTPTPTQPPHPTSNNPSTSTPNPTDTLIATIGTNFPTPEPYEFLLSLPPNIQNQLGENRDISGYWAVALFGLEQDGTGRASAVGGYLHVQQGENEFDLIIHNCEDGEGNKKIDSIQIYAPHSTSPIHSYDDCDDKEERKFDVGVLMPGYYFVSILDLDTSADDPEKNNQGNSISIRVDGLQDSTFYKTIPEENMVAEPYIRYLLPDNVTNLISAPVDLDDAETFVLRGHATEDSQEIKIVAGYLHVQEATSFRVKVKGCEDDEKDSKTLGWISLSSPNRIGIVLADKIECYKEDETVLELNSKGSGYYYLYIYDGDTSGEERNGNTINIQIINLADTQLYNEPPPQDSN